MTFFSSCYGGYLFIEDYTQGNVYGFGSAENYH